MRLVRLRREIDKRFGMRSRHIWPYSAALEPSNTLMGDGIGTVYRHNRLNAADTRPVLRMTEKI
jgi:hypothetical protein